MTAHVTEDTVEQAALGWLQEMGYTLVHGPGLAPDQPGAERADMGSVVLEGRLRAAVARFNPDVPRDAQEEAVRKVLRPETPSLVRNNRAFHHMLRDGVEVEYRDKDGTTRGTRVWLADFGDARANDWLAVNQFTVIEGQHNRRPDIVTFLNGLPLAVIELKNATDEEATIWTAWNQLQTYKGQIPSLFVYNGALVVSDGLQARMGSLTAGREWFKVWRTVGGVEEPAGTLELETLLRGAFEPGSFLRLVRHFVAFEEDSESERIHKILAGYHQFDAVEQAVNATLRASGMAGQDAETIPMPGLEGTGAMLAAESQAAFGKADRRCGVVWHTQGSGKSFSMLFYAGQVASHPLMNNPTLVVLTDRNDLDDQLFGQFLRCRELLRQDPVQADDREHLRRLLKVSSGGVVFTTIQKFMPEEKGGRMDALTERRNVIVIADEAHRSQYDMIDGLARNMRDALPNASFIGFTGTPIEKLDANTRAVFGDYVSIYDIEQAVKDGATVPIYYENRIAKLSLEEGELPGIDDEVEEITEGEEENRREKLKSKWAALEALVGSGKRLELVAKDLVEHFEARLEAMDGKAMIVCMSRRICVDLYNAITRLRPNWHSEDDDKGVVKVVMTGGATDPLEWQGHVRNKQRRKGLATRFKDSKDPLKLVIVRDMWLTGFDVPCLHTMYADKPMKGHGLMQAIARVNRVFRDKPGGLVVDYLGLADQLKQALSTYTESGGKGNPAVDTAEAILAMQEVFEKCRGMMHGFDWSAFLVGTPQERMRIIPAGQEHILQQEDGKARFCKLVTELSKAFALCASSDEAKALRDDISFFQAVKVAISKNTGERRPQDEMDAAVRQLLSRAIATEGEVIDVFEAAGLKKPDISILSEEFLAEVQGMQHKNLAVEFLKKILGAEIKTQSKRNVVQARSFSDLLKRTLNAYHNRTIATHEIIEELLTLARQMRDASKRGEELGLKEDELAFYDALAQNESAVEAMQIDQLKVLAAELVTHVRKSVTIDWNVRESARARIRVQVRRILRKYGYPPDLQEEATRLVLEQAEVICKDLAA